MGWVINFADKLLDSVIDNPLRWVAQIAGAFIGIPPYVTSAAVAAAQGGNLLDIAKSAAIGYAGSALTSSIPSSQFLADIKNYTVNSWVGDFTDSMMNNFNLAPDQAVQLAKLSSDVLNSTISSGIKTALTGGSIQDGISSGLTSGLVKFSTDSFFDSVNKDSNWGLSQQAVNLMKGSTSAALNTFLSGKGDPAEAAGAYLANAFLNLAGSSVSSGMKEMTKLLSTDTDAAKAAQDNFTNLRAEFDTQVAFGEALRAAILNDVERYQKTLDEQFLPIKAQQDELVAQNTAALNDFNTNKQIYDENKWAYENYADKMRDLGYGMAYTEEGGGYARIVGGSWGVDADGTRTIIPDGSLLDSDDNPRFQYVYDAPTRDEFYTAANNAAAAANAASEKYTATRDAVEKLYQDNKPMIDGLADARAQIETKVADLQKIRDDVENPNGTNLASRLITASNEYQAKYDAWANTRDATDRYAESYTKALAEVATRNATIDALNSGVIKVTGKDADGNWTLSNNMTLTGDGKFMQDGKMVFASAEGLQQNALDFLSGDGGGGGGGDSQFQKSDALDYIRKQIQLGNKDFIREADGSYRVDDPKNDKMYMFGSDGSYLGSIYAAFVTASADKDYIEPKTSAATKDFIDNLYTQFSESEINKNPFMGGTSASSGSGGAGSGGAGSGGAGSGEAQAQTPLDNAKKEIRSLIGFGPGNPDSQYRSLFGSGPSSGDESSMPGIIAWGPKAVTYLDVVINDPNSSQEDIKVAQQAKEKIVQAAAENPEAIAKKDSVEPPPPVEPAPVAPPPAEVVPVAPPPAEPAPVTPPPPVEPAPVATEKAPSGAAAGEASSGAAAAGSTTGEASSGATSGGAPAASGDTSSGAPAGGASSGATAGGTSAGSTAGEASSGAPAGGASASGGASNIGSTGSTATGSTGATSGATTKQDSDLGLYINQGIDINNRINALVAQGLSNQEATERAIKEAQDKISNLGTSVNARINELTAQGLSNQQATEQAIKETQGKISDLGTSVNARINELTAQGLSYQQATEQAIKETQGKISDLGTSVNARISELTAQGLSNQEATERAIRETQGSISDLGTSFNARVNELIAQGLSNQKATEQAFKETQGKVSDLGASVNARINELTAQGLSNQEATERAIKETQGKVSDLGSSVNARINELIAQGLSNKEATDQAIGEVRGQVTQARQDLGSQITQVGEDLGARISDTQGQLGDRIDELMKQGQDFKTATNTAIGEVKAKQDAAAAAARAKEDQAKAESNLAQAVSLTATPTTATEESTPFKKIGLKTTGEAKFEGPLEQYLKMVKGTNYAQKPAEAQQQSQQQVQQGANVQQDLLTPQPDQLGSDYFSYGQQTEIDRMLASTQSPEMNILQSKAGGLATPLMAMGGSARGGLNIVEHSGKRRLDFRQGAAVNGPGDGQSDDIPAMLAQGEYVLDSETVSALGNGSTKAGSILLDEFRKHIRRHKRSGPLDSIPPKSKSPLEYLEMARKSIGKRR